MDDKLDMLAGKKVTVEHVHVHAGGQAVVDMVDARLQIYSAL